MKKSRACNARKKEEEEDEEKIYGIGLRMQLTNFRMIRGLWILVPFVRSKEERYCEIHIYITRVNSYQLERHMVGERIR